MIATKDILIELQNMSTQDRNDILKVINNTNTLCATCPKKGQVCVECTYSDLLF